MEYFAGMDVAMEETSICVLDQDGKVVLETAVATDPDAIFKALKNHIRRLRRVGHEAGSLSPWLQVELKQRGLPAICLEAWHARAALSAMRNKTDKADARGIAHIVRTGWFREVHVKSEESYRLRLLLTQRRNLKRKFLDIENAIRHSIKTFGLKVGKQPRPIRGAGARAGGGRSADRRTYRLHAAGASGVVAGICAAAPSGDRDRAPRQAVPALHAHSGRGADQRARLQDGGR